MSTLETFKAAYDTEIVEFAVGGRAFRFHTPRTLERFIDPDNPLHNFPLWAKVWEASLLLASKLASRPVRRGERLLELGAGLGVAGLVAAAFGHEVTVTEYDPHALAFLEANRLENHCRHAHVHRLDWHRLDLDDRYDVILGSELMYRGGDFKAIRALFLGLIHSAGEILLCGEIRQTNKAFLDCMQSAFRIQIAKNNLRSDSRTIPLLLIRMTPKGERK